MKVFIKEPMHTRVAMSHFSALRIFIRWRRRARKGWLSLGMSVGFLRHQFAATAANFEQVEQSGIEWSFGDLAEWKIAEGNFPHAFLGPIKRLNKYDFSNRFAVGALWMRDRIGDSKIMVMRKAGGENCLYRAAAWWRPPSRITSLRNAGERKQSGPRRNALHSRRSWFPGKFTSQFEV